MKFYFASALFLIAGVYAFAAKTSRLSFPGNGFSIDALEATNPSEDQPAAPLVMTLPPTGGFAPNINISIQPYGGNIEDYVILSEGQFKDGKYKIVASKKQGGKGWQWEYTGTSNNLALHFYSRVMVNGKKAFLATATASETQWKIHADKLKSVVDSFKLD